jgi:hypothetical protein
MPSLYRIADALASPSVKEAFGLVVLKPWPAARRYHLTHRALHRIFGEATLSDATRRISDSLQIRAMKHSRRQKPIFRSDHLLAGGSISGLSATTVESFSRTKGKNIESLLNSRV